MARVDEERLAKYRELDREAFDFAEPAVAAFFARAAAQGYSLDTTGFLQHPGFFQAPYRRSAAGADIAMVGSPLDLGAIGLSVCFDLRFADLYARLRNLGAELITIPAAFTATTGRDHWHVLIRARAIETQCYVLAAAQQGSHDDDGLRESFGHSLIVDPWGEVLAEATDGPGVVLAQIDLDRVVQVRQAIPMQTPRPIYR